MFADFRINNFRLIDRIGSGAYGLVFKARNTIDNKIYAIKAILRAEYTNRTLKNHVNESHAKQKQNLEFLLYAFFQKNHHELYLPAVDLDSILALTKEQLDQVPHYKEIALHLSVHDHPNIVSIHNVFESSIATFIVMDYYENDLFTSIVDKQYFANDGLLVKDVFLKICTALQYCHSMGVYHCDIKPENILLDASDNVYLCDFGLATDSKYLAPNVCVGSFYYMAPERILYSSAPLETETAVLPTATSDIWSLGIILINLVCMRNPWLKAHQGEDATFQFFIENNKILQKILPISDELLDVLGDILCLEPCRRIALDVLMAKIRSIKKLTPDGPLSQIPEIEPHKPIAAMTISQDLDDEDEVDELHLDFSEKTRMLSGAATPFEEITVTGTSTCSTTTAISSSYENSGMLCKGDFTIATDGFTSHQKLLEEKLLKLQSESLTTTGNSGNWLPEY